MAPPRTAVVWCPDWPVIAAEIMEDVDATGPVIVLHDNRVLACSPAARADGVRRGLRKREAQSRSPRAVVITHDPGRDARAFEPVVAAVEEVAAGVAVLRPGACAFAARGPARYFGGELAAAERVIEQIAEVCAVEAQLGIAEGIFAAQIAARAGRVVPPGETPRYLAGLPIELLDRPALTDLLRRLGLRTLGAFANLHPSDVLARFGLDAAMAHRLAAGLDSRPLAVRRPPPELAVSDEFDEPLERVDVAAFAARSLAERLHEGLAAHGLACTRLAIAAITVKGEELHRVWRHDGVLTTAAIMDRVRWQLDGWLTPGGRVARPTGGIRRLTLNPEGVLTHVGLQPGLWGETGAERERAHRAMTRVQGLLGPSAVVMPVRSGGRDPGQAFRLVPWGDERSAPPARPWPGSLPQPAPAFLPPDQPEIAVVDADGRPVRVSARLELSAPPAAVAVERSTVAVVGWTGPWPVDERWWSAAESRRAARLQVALADGRSLLVALSGGRWRIEAAFD